MKNRYAKVLLLIPSLLFSSCKGKEEDAVKNSSLEAWQQFSSNLSLTSSLMFYSIDIQINDNKGVTNEKKVLSQKEDSTYIAYHELNEQKSYWIEGFSYEIENGEKIKVAKSLKSFLDINQAPISLSYDEVSSSFYKADRKVFFDYCLDGYQKVSFEFQLGQLFIENILASFYQNNSIIKTASYKYNNPGKNPTITLPSDLAEYSY